jgi:hypothetical protein
MLATTYGVNMTYNIQQGLADRYVAWRYARFVRQLEAQGEPVPFPTRDL